MFQEILTKIDFISPIFYQILYMTVVGSIVGLIVYFIRNIFDNKISGKWKCIMWWIVLVTLLIPIRFEIKTDRNVPKIQNEIIEKVEDIKYIGNYENLEQKPFEEIVHTTNIENNDEILQNNENISKPEINIQPKKDMPFKIIVINIIIPYIWLFGIFIFILTFLSGILKINKRISRNVYKDERLENILNDCKNQLNIKRKIKIILQKYKKVPSIFGIFNPSILITEKTLQEDNETIKYIFLHELAHYKRKDMIFNFALLCVLSIYWFNPVVWFLFNKIRQDIEIGADELASKKLNKNEKKEYGMVLINLLRNKQEENYTANMLCMSDTGKNMERRILMIKGKTKSVIVSFVLVTIIVGIIAGVVFVKVTQREINVGNDIGANLNNNMEIEELTEQERIAVEEYVDKICNTQAILKEFKNIEEVDRIWLFSHITPRHSATEQYNAPYSSKEEIEEDLKELFGIDIVIDDKEILSNLHIAKSDDRYLFMAHDYYSEPKYVVNDIQKIKGKYIVNVIEYFEVCDLDEKYKSGSHMLIYNYNQYSKSERIRELGEELFNVDFAKYDDSEIADKVVGEEVLKRQDEFRLFNIVVIPNNEGGLFVKEVNKISENESSAKEISNTNLPVNNTTSTTQVGNLDLEITGGSGFSDGLAYINLKGEEKGVYIDKKGNIVLKCEVSGDFHEGLAIAYKEVGRLKYKYGYIDKQGNVAIDYIYDAAYSFVDGLAPVQKDGKWFYIDSKGNTVGDYFEQEYTLDYFSEGKRWIRNEDGKVACVDKQGNIIIDYIYDNAMSFSEGLCCVEKNGKFGYIDSQGNVVIDIKYDVAHDNYGHGFSDGLALIYDEGKYKYLDKQGNIALVSPYEKAGSFTEGLAWSYKNGKYGFIDKQGNVVIDFQYDSLEGGFSEGLALVEKNGNYAFIDHTGKVIIGKLN